MRIEASNRKKLLETALGNVPADIALINARMVNVITGEIYPANVFISDEMIAHIEMNDFEAHLEGVKKIYDLKGDYIIPGLIDAHGHIESSMLTPRNFAKAVVPLGTTTMVTDPHEIANVYGVRGVEYMHDSALDLPMRQFINIPSCVPSVPGKEYAGADFTANEILKLVDKKNVIGLAEVMDFVAVTNGSDRMMDILNVARDNNLYIQGHAPYVNGRLLSAYLCGGPYTDHESTTASDAIEKLRNGMYVDARESSVAQDAKAVFEGVSQSRYLDTVCLCTDDRETEDILNEGHLNHVVNKMIEAGMDPIDAIRSATFNTAREIRFDNLGAIAPGYVADILVTKSIESLDHFEYVFFEGKLVAQDGLLIDEIKDYEDAIQNENSVHLKELSHEDLRIKAPIQDGEVEVNVLVVDSVNFTATTSETISVKVSNYQLQLEHDYNFVMVANRHKGYDNLSLGVIRGYGSKHGAVASTVAHDSHNLIVVYDTVENGLVAVDALRQSGGGMCAVDKGEVISLLELPVAGLMSDKEPKQLAKDSIELKEAIRSLGMGGVSNPLLRIVFLSLIVIPVVRMSDIGLINVYTQEVIPLFNK